jgi:hypothetical protein
MHAVWPSGSPAFTASSETWCDDMRWSFIDWPGIDAVLVGLTLRELEREYSARVGRARSGSERAALVERWAVASLRELVGVEGSEARDLRRFYRAVAGEGGR